MSHETALQRLTKLIRQGDFGTPKTVLGGKTSIHSARQAPKLKGESKLKIREPIASDWWGEVIMHIAITQMTERVSADPGQDLLANIVRTPQELVHQPRGHRNVVFELGA